MKTRPKIVVLASGSGTTLEYLVKASQAGELAGDIVGLVTNKPESGAVVRADSPTVKVYSCK